MFEDDQDLLISGIQHFVFCRRQWALIHIEMQWKDSAHTVAGDIFHARAHDMQLKEKRGELLTTHGMPVFSRKMRVRGVCDVVEFRRGPGGVALFGREGLWTPCPVEYKSGGAKAHDADRLQLCAQAMCLEEMLLCQPIQTAFLYYGETKRHEPVALDGDLRETVNALFLEMRGFFDRSHTPRAKLDKKCKNCSLKDICLPEMPDAGRVDSYIADAIAEDSPP